MVRQEELVVVGAHLDRARRKLEGADASECGTGGAWVDVLDRVRSSRQRQQASAGLERALVYLHAAHEVMGDVADDVAQGATARVVEDLRLLERQCAMVDELIAHVAGQLAMTSPGDSTADERGRALAIVQTGSTRRGSALELPGVWPARSRPEPTRRPRTGRSPLSSVWRRSSKVVGRRGCPTG